MKIKATLKVKNPKLYNYILLFPRKLNQLLNSTHVVLKSNRYSAIIFILGIVTNPCELIAQNKFTYEYSSARTCELVAHSSELNNCKTLQNNSNFIFDFDNKSIVLLIDKKHRIDLKIEKVLTMLDGLHIACSDIKGGDVLIEVYENGQIWLKNRIKYRFSK
jgi:hypothetical protein